MENHFEKSDAYSRYLSFQEDRVMDWVISPCDYITGVKLKKAIKTLTDEEVEDLFDDEMDSEKLLKQREFLKEKIDLLISPQYQKALYLLYKEGNTTAFAYIIKCKVVKPKERKYK